MNMLRLASLIAKKEGKKSKARVGDIREILSILSDLIVQESTVVPYCSETVCILLGNGIKRAKKQRKKVKK